MGPKAKVEDLSFEEVIDLPGMSKEKLYIRANSWFVDIFNSAESVIQFQDKEEGRLMGKYVTDAEMSVYNYLIKSTIQVDIKDEKVRLLFKDPYFKAISDDTGNVYNEDYKVLDSKDGVMLARRNWKALSVSFKEYMNSNDDW